MNIYQPPTLLGQTGFFISPGLGSTESECPNTCVPSYINWPNTLGEKMTMKNFANSFIKRAAISLILLTVLNFSAASNAQAKPVLNSKYLLANQSQSNTPTHVSGQKKNSKETAQQAINKKPNRIFRINVSTNIYRGNYRKE
jgi:hypothetical protein